MLHNSAVAACVGVLAILAWRGPLAAQAPPQTFPPEIEKYLAAEVKPTAAERAALLKGAPLTKLLPTDEGKEVFVFGAVWIDAAANDYVRQVTDIETFERGGAFRVTKKISDPPRAADFAQLELPDEDVKDLKGCKAGDCEVKLSAKGLEALKDHVRWGTPNETIDVNTQFRRLALEYVTGYREGGNTRLAVYRDADHPVFVANEFRSMIERAPSLARMPDLLTYLLDYPAARLADSSDFLYWQEAEFGLKPTVRINHLVIQNRPAHIVIASKMLYASHYFWTALEQRVLTPDPARGKGFWFVTISRSRSDGLTGFVGGLIRGRVQSEAQKGTEAVLKATKAKLEGRPAAKH